MGLVNTFMIEIAGSDGSDMVLWYAESDSDEPSQNLHWGGGGASSSRRLEGVARELTEQFYPDVNSTEGRRQERQEDHRREMQGRVEQAAVADRPDVRPRNAALAARAQEERVPFATDPVALARTA